MSIVEFGMYARYKTTRKYEDTAYFSCSNNWKRQKLTIVCKTAPKFHITWR